jgi:hypothetical protein
LISKQEVALKYIEFLEKGDFKNLLKLFSHSATVDSPVYGIKLAEEFYKILEKDTQSSELIIKGIFEDNQSNNIALYFNYKWTLIDEEYVEFDVVDIIELNNSNFITNLKIIYDTVKSRKLVHKLKG